MFHPVRLMFFPDGSLAVAELWIFTSLFYIWLLDSETSCPLELPTPEGSLNRCLAGELRSRSLGAGTSPSPCLCSGNGRRTWEKGAGRTEDTAQCYPRGFWAAFMAWVRRRRKARWLAQPSMWVSARFWGPCPISAQGCPLCLRRVLHTQRGPVPCPVLELLHKKQTVPWLRWRHL